MPQGDDVLLDLVGVGKNFPAGDGKVVQACSNVTLTIRAGETLGVVGESGSGKTTLGRSIIRLVEPTTGSISFDGRDLLQLGKAEMRRARSQIQMVFQEPMESLNPRLSIGTQLSDPLRLHTDMNRAQRRERVDGLLDQVGLPRSVARERPAALSAGWAQRASIARAIATRPKLIILDEPTSALAPEAQADILALLATLQEELHVSYVFISHDLNLVGQICDRIAVMYLSEVVELGPVRSVFDNPRHPYTRALLGATLRPDPRQRYERGLARERLGGEIPSPIDLPKGCYLAGRCLFVRDRCRAEKQTLHPIESDHSVRCWRVDEGELLPVEISAELDAQRVGE